MLRVRRSSVLLVLALSNLCACGAIVAPLERDSAVLSDASRDAAMPSSPAAARIFVAESATFVIDADRRAFAWGFVATGAGDGYRAPGRAPALDGALAVYSLDSTITCALIAQPGQENSVRCSVATHAFSVVPWAAGSRAIALSSGTQRMWALSTTGTVRFSQPLVFADLVREPVLRLDGFLPGVSDAQTLACSSGVCCSTTRRGELVCWGADATTPVPAGTDPQQARSISRATRVAHSAMSATRCAQDENAPMFCWGQGVHNAFGFTAPDAMDPQTRCAIEGSPFTVDCVRFPGASFEGVDIDPALGVGSTALVLRARDGAIVVEGPSRSWLAALDPQPISTREAAMGAPLALRGLRPDAPFAISSGHACWAEGARVLCAGSNYAGQLGVDRRAVRASDAPIEVRLAP